MRRSQDILFEGSTDILMPPSSGPLRWDPDPLEQYMKVPIGQYYCTKFVKGDWRKSTYAKLDDGCIEPNGRLRRALLEYLATHSGWHGSEKLNSATGLNIRLVLPSLRRQGKIACCKRGRAFYYADLDYAAKEKTGNDHIKDRLLLDILE
jgi:hypothetical protein